MKKSIEDQLSELQAKSIIHDALIEAQNTAMNMLAYMINPNELELFKKKSTKIFQEIVTEKMLAHPDISAHINDYMKRLFE